MPVSKREVVSYAAWAECAAFGSLRPMCALIHSGVMPLAQRASATRAVAEVSL